MGGRNVSVWVSTAVLMAVTLGGALLVAGAAAAASPSGCGVTVRGENVGDTALQTAINGAHAGEKICVAAGTYPEQLVIHTAGVHLSGAGVGATIIAPTTGVANAVDYDSGSNAPLVAVVVVANVSGVVLSDLTINAAGAAASIGGCSPGVVALDFQNVSAARLTASTIEGAELAPSLLGCQSQTDVYAYTGYFETGYTPAHAVVTIQSSTIQTYGKGGIVCDDPGLSCTITGTTVTGIGPTPAIAGNGIQVAYGAGAMISRDRVTANDYTGATATNDFYGNGYAASGILLYEAAAGTRVEHSSLSGNQISIAGYDDVSDLIEDNTVLNSIAYGIAEYGTPTTTATIVGNVISNPTTKSLAVFVANGTYSIRGNAISYVLDSGIQGASQAITGPGTVYPSAAPVSIATAAIQAVSDGGPTIVVDHHNTFADVSLRLATATAFQGTVTVTQ